MDGIVGHAVAVVGNARILSARHRAPIARDGAISEGDTIETGGDGYVYIATVDHGFISVRPDSSLTFERFQYDASAPKQSVIKLVLHKGTMREISGEGAQAARDHYRLNTPVAALGVRGTDFSVFTTGDTTRADVRSGGIVMTPLGGSCLSSGNGPCEGPAAAQLFADQRDAMLQVERGSTRPLLLENRLAAVSPQGVATQKNEDNAAHSVTGQTQGDVGVAPLELQFMNTIPAQTPQAPPAPPAPDAPAPPPAPPPKPEAQQIFWGRFAALASQPADTSLDKLLKQGSEQIDINMLFAMTRTPQTDMVMPVQGVFGFGLQSSAAYLVNASTGAAVPGAISNASLTIDFGKRAFATQLDLSANNGTYAIKGRGAVLDDGRLTSDYGSPASIHGALAGKTATQAGYLFLQSIDAKTSAIGATQWAR
ncbi:FecR domain-containing protein [Paraburkholderia sp. LEh10]|uniref:FecR family protein n=1 Tax=Paraburkholderia sp. LEh10 TaxID=2821353 RepID=UPI001AE44A4A|nr:FecR family protein [Paraburkholderia sp. LEh10]MBP0595355.1 FecR domain-containing protein [Paraburkholderia sp. LEh10]